MLAWRQGAWATCAAPSLFSTQRDRARLGRVLHRKTSVGPGLASNGRACDGRLTVPLPDGLVDKAQFIDDGWR